MKKLLCLLCLLVFGGAVSADVTVTPNDIVERDVFENSSTAIYGYDWDTVPLTASNNVAYIGTGSFYGNVTGSANGGGVDYAAIRINVSNLFGYDVTLADFVDLSYSSYYVSGALDWQVKIYTEVTDPYDTNNYKSWANSRINYNRGDTIADGLWDTYSISSLGIDASNTKGDYLADEKIMYIDIILGYMTNSPAGESYLDNVVLTAFNQEGTDTITYCLDLEPSAVVPAPGAVFLAGLGSMFASRIRRRMA